MHKPEKNDEELVSLIQSGKIELFGILIQRYDDKMNRYARKFLSDAEDTKDVVQEIFIKVYVNIQSFDTKRKFSSWLYRIAHNELVNALKKKKIKKIFPLFDLDIFIPHLHRSENTFHDDAERRDIKNSIGKCLNALDEKYREPVILFYFEELSYEEISDVMQIPVSTVGVRIKRAKDIMQSILRKQNNHG